MVYVCRASAAVEAAQRELAGAEAGDGRDESNRSMQERLADAQNAQVPPSPPPPPFLSHHSHPNLNLALYALPGTPLSFLQ